MGVNGRIGGNRQLYYRGYRLFKAQGNFVPTDAEIGDRLSGRGEGLFDGGEEGDWVVTSLNPTTNAGVTRIVSVP